MPKLLRSYSSKNGKRASEGRPSSKVKVYERADAPGTIWMDRRWIATERGNPIPKRLKHGTTWEAAKLLAEETSLARERLLLQGVDDFGEEPETPKATLREVLDGYHASRAATRWGEGHARDQDRCRRFCLDVLGEGDVAGGDRIAEEISEDEIERKIAAAGERLGWETARSEQRYIQYLRTVGKWAYRKGKLTDRPLWMALELPKYRPDTRGRTYSVEETRLLFTPHPEVDWRVTLAASIAADTGRRISAIANVWVGLEGEEQPSDLTVLELELEEDEPVELMWVLFRRDKGGRTAIRPVSPETRSLIEEAAQRPEVRESGWLFPEGRADVSGEMVDKPMSSSSLIKLLRKAEKVLGIPYVKRKGYHGLKKRHVTVGFEVTGGDETLVGDMVGNLDMALLRGTYRQEDLRRIAQLSRKVSEVFRGRESGQEPGHEPSTNEDGG